MDANFRKQLEENGADVDMTLKRFMGNEAIYMKFIMKFLDDKSFDSIKDNLEKNDYEEVFKGAHTLKGVTANLGLDPINTVASQMCELLRGKQNQDGDVDTGKLNELFGQLEEVHGRFHKILMENKQ